MLRLEYRVTKNLTPLYEYCGYAVSLQCLQFCHATYTNKAYTSHRWDHTGKLSDVLSQKSRMTAGVLSQ